VGSDVLTVTGGSTDDPNYSLVGATFPITLGNRAKTTLTVRFAPAGACNPCAWNLLLASNDPDTPTFAVPLAGIGVTPPEIGVARLSAARDEPGAERLTTTKPVVIHNGRKHRVVRRGLRAAMIVVGRRRKARRTIGRPRRTGGRRLGGPDAFGYRWATRRAIWGPFDWVDITAWHPSRSTHDRTRAVPDRLRVPVLREHVLDFRTLERLISPRARSPRSQHHTPNAEPTVPENLAILGRPDFRPPRGARRSIYDER
jgi:hypothetical protein